MKRIHILVAAMLVLVSLMPLASGDQEKVRVFVTFDGTPNPGVADEVNGQVVYQFESILQNTLVLELPRSAVDNLKTKPGVLRVEEDTATYGLGQTLPWGVDRIDADLQADTGDGVNVCVTDSGADKFHEDLRLAGGRNFVSAEGSPGQWNDLNGHGTHVLGTIAALDNTVGVEGTAPDADLYMAKVLNQNLVGSASDLIAGIDWCVTKNAGVISMSLGAANVQIIKDALEDAYAADAVLVAAAGNNNGGQVEFPATYHLVIAVSATQMNDTIADFSSQGSEVELAAPGVSINSTEPNNLYGRRSGTSFAAPHVSGVAAIARSLNPSFNNTQIRELLQNTAEDLGAAGRDNLYGFGMVNAELN